MTAASQRELTWPGSQRAYLTLDFECDYGTALDANHYNAVETAPRLVDVLEAHEVPLSVFLQTEILETCPETVTPFIDAAVPVEFHAHSHTHPPRKEADAEYEIAESVRRVRRRFNTDPIGFRFPDGAVHTCDYDILADNEVAFSSSVFPSWRPGRFNNLRSRRGPHRMAGSDVVELPFTVYSGYVRVPVSLSYLKLFGTAYERLVSTRPPPVIVFDFHMHDLVAPPTFEALSTPLKAVYTRHKHDGLAMLNQLVEALLEQGYEFGQMTDLYTDVTRSDVAGVTDTNER